MSNVSKILIYRTFSLVFCEFSNMINHQSRFFSPHRLCFCLIYTFLYVDMLDVTAGYGRLSDLIAFFRIFIYYYYYKFETLYLHQTFTDYVLVILHNYSIPSVKRICMP